MIKSAFEGCVVESRGVVDAVSSETCPWCSLQESGDFRSSVYLLVNESRLSRTSAKVLYQAVDQRDNRGRARNPLRVRGGVTR